MQRSVETERRCGKAQLMAPEIHRINNKWYIYYAADDGNTDNHQIFVLENDAETPMTGEFKQKGPIIFQYRLELGNTCVNVRA